MNDDHQPDVVFGESQSWYPNLSSHFIFDPNQDAQAEGRTAHPMDENIRFSNNIEIINDGEPFGIQDTQAHDMVIFDNLNNIQRIDAIINNEHDSINEDATLYNNVGNNIIVSVTENNSRSNQTNFAVEQPVSTVSAEETQRRFDTRQAIIVATCSTSMPLPKRRTLMESSDDSEEEESTK